MITGGTRREDEVSFVDTTVMTTGTNTGATDHTTIRTQCRADVVMADLVKRGINATRLTARGYGDTMPRADNATPEGRAKNRRTEFVVVVGGEGGAILA